MALKRKATASWEGTLREGKGTMTYGSYSGNFSFTSRFENGEGTNPEELVGAAHAGCFSMAFNAEMERAGFVPQQVNTTANVKFEKTDDGWRITGIHLACEAKVEGISNEKFQELANNAKQGCPISNALKAVPITMEAKLV